MAQGYAAFPNAGKRVDPYAAIEIHNSRGELIYRHDRDGPRPMQVLSQQVAADMNFLLSKVPEEGTGKRAALPGIRSAGKTGTTDAYRNAWYVGYTGNMVAAVWLGNDDYSPTNNMTGGSLPAMVWHEVMSYAHQGLEIKPIHGLTPLEPAPGVAPVAQNRPTGFEILSPTRPSILSKRGTEILGAIDDQFRAVQTRRAGDPQQRVDTGAVTVLTPAGASLAARAIGGGTNRP
jgi:penicillin-binding protein 1A